MSRGNGRGPAPDRPALAGSLTEQDEHPERTSSASIFATRRREDAGADPWAQRCLRRVLAVAS